MWSEIVFELSIVGIMMVGGLVFAIQFIRVEDRLDLLSVAFPIGSGIFSWAVFLFSWAGIPLNSFTLKAIGTLLMLSGVTLLNVRRKWTFPRLLGGTKDPIEGARPMRVFLGVILGVFAVMMVGLAIGRSYSSWDSMAIWSIKGYGISLEETIFGGENWGEFGLNYPLNTPLLIAAFDILSGDELPGSKAIFPMLFFCLILGCFTFLTQRKVKTQVAGLGASFLATTPFIFEHGTIGYANLPFGIFLALGVFHGIQGFLEGERGRQTVSGIMFALAAWTRPEGVLVIPLVIVALFVAHRITRQGRIYWRHWLMPIFIIVGPWMVFLQRYSSDSLILSAARVTLAAIGDGELRLGSFYLTGRYMIGQLLTPSIWGIAFPVAVILLALNLWKLRPRDNPDLFFILFAGLAMALSTVFHFYFVTFLGAQASWLTTSANRMFIPAAILLISWIVLLAGKEYQQDKIPPRPTNTGHG